MVAFPQNPEAALRAVGITPQSLAKTLIVQYVGENREHLRHDPDLSVFVDKLRRAFAWLSVNSWPFLYRSDDISCTLGDRSDPPLAT